MTLLAIETSSPRGSIAVAVDGDVVFYEEWQRPKGRPRKGEKFLSHSEMVGLVIEKALSQIDLQISDIDLLLTSIGPGSFTGIRVGLAAVKSLGFALDTPCKGYNSLQVLAENGRGRGLPLLSLVNAYKNQVYASAFSSSDLQPLWGPVAIELDQINEQLTEPNYLGLGDGFAVYAETLSTEVRQKVELLEDNELHYPNARGLIQLHLNTQDDGQKRRWSDLNPLYLRASEAEEKLQAGLLKPVEEL